MNSRRRVLVTGASGFIGRHAVAALEAMGHEVVQLMRFQEGAPQPAGTVFCDLLRERDLKAVVEAAGADTLLHLAWETRHNYFWDAPENLEWLAASVRLIKCVRAAGGRRVVVAGTCAEYASVPNGLCEATTTPCEPYRLYGTAKDSLNRIVSQYARSVGLSYAWGRVFHLSGPGEASPRLVPAAWQALTSGKVFATGTGKKLLDLMDSRDCGRAFAHLTVSGHEGAINIASGEPRRIRDVLLALAEMAGRSDLIGFGLRPEPAGGLSDRWADVSPLRVTLGFVPQYSLHDTLRAATACGDGLMEDR